MVILGALKEVGKEFATPSLQPSQTHRDRSRQTPETKRRWQLADKLAEVTSNYRRKWALDPALDTSDLDTLMENTQNYTDLATIQLMRQKYFIRVMLKHAKTHGDDFIEPTTAEDIAVILLLFIRKNKSVKMRLDKFMVQKLHAIGNRYPCELLAYDDVKSVLQSIAQFEDRIAEKPHAVIEMKLANNDAALIAALISDEPGFTTDEDTFLQAFQVQFTLAHDSLVTNCNIDVDTNAKLLAGLQNFQQPENYLRFCFFVKVCQKFRGDNKNSNVTIERVANYGSCLLQSVSPHESLYDSPMGTLFDQHTQYGLHRVMRQDVNNAKTLVAYGQIFDQLLKHKSTLGEHVFSKKMSELCKCLEAGTEISSNFLDDSETDVSHSDTIKQIIKDSGLPQAKSATEFATAVHAIILAMDSKFPEDNTKAFDAYVELCTQLLTRDDLRQYREHDNHGRLAKTKVAKLHSDVCGYLVAKMLLCQTKHVAHSDLSINVKSKYARIQDKVIAAFEKATLDSNTTCLTWLKAGKVGRRSTEISTTYKIATSSTCCSLFAPSIKKKQRQIGEKVEKYKDRIKKTANIK